MTPQRRIEVARKAVEEAFAAQVGKLFGVYISAGNPDDGLDLFREGFRKAVLALEAIEKELTDAD